MNDDLMDDNLIITDEHITRIAEFYGTCRARVVASLFVPSEDPQEIAMEQTQDLYETLKEGLKVDPVLAASLVESFAEGFEHHDEIDPAGLKTVLDRGELSWEDPQPGVRQFECDTCGHAWEEESRDAKSPSLSVCPECNSETHPHDFELDAAS